MTELTTPDTSTKRGRQGVARRTSALIAALVAVLPFFVSAARAESTAGPLTLTWNAPAACPREQNVLATSRAMLGAETGTERPVVARAVVSRTLRGFRVNLTTTRDGTPGERTLEADSCDALARATALILVLTVDPTRAASLTAVGAATEGSTPTPAPTPTPTPTPAPTPAPTPTPTPTPAPAPTPTPTPTPAPRRAPLFAAFAGVALDDGSLPSPSLGGALGVAVLPRFVRLEVSGTLWTSSNAVLPSGTGGTFRLWSLGGRACGAFPVGPFELGPCGAYDLAFAHAEGFGASQSLTGDTMWGIVGLGGDAFWSALPPFGLRLRIDGFAPTSRPPFVVLEPTEHVPLHRPSSVGVRGAVGLEVRFL